MSQALSNVNIEALCESDDQKWRMIGFMVGCVANSRIAIEKRSDQVGIVAGVLARIFDWPLDISRRYIEEVFVDADLGRCSVELESGSRSIREFESSIDRLKSVLVA
jgi:hypothetical protein